MGWCPGAARDDSKTRHDATGSSGKSGTWVWNRNGKPELISLNSGISNPLSFRTFRERPMRKITIEQKWHEQAEAYKQEAGQLPHGRERDELLRKARQLETASHINDWLTSPGLSPPS